MLNVGLSGLLTSKKYWFKEVTLEHSYLLIIKYKPILNCIKIKNYNGLIINNLNLRTQ